MQAVRRFLDTLFDEGTAPMRRLPDVLKTITVIVGCSLVLCLYMVAVGIAGILASDRPIHRVEMEDRDYVLTCRDTLDGPIELLLYECVDHTDEDCTVVERAYSEPPCSGLHTTLRIDDGVIRFETTGATKCSRTCRIEVVRS